jgi:hypothetical protein
MGDRPGLSEEHFGRRVRSANNRSTGAGRSTLKGGSVPKCPLR